MVICRLTFILILLLAATPCVPAQRSNTPTAPEQANAPLTPEQQEAKQELERKALLLLDDVINDAKVFKNAENRLIIKVIAGDLLWPRNEARARTLFKEAANSFSEVMSTSDDSDAQEIPFLNTSAELRRSLIQTLARHDPQWARELLRSTRPAASAAIVRGRAVGADEELQLEQSVASQIAANDPKQALEMAEQTLSKGLSYELVNTVSLLLRKDREAAARLASKIVTKLQTENLQTNEAAMHIATSLLHITAEPAQPRPGADATPILSLQEMRDLTELVSAAALNSSSNAYSVLALQPLLPQIEKYAPARVAQLRRKISEAQRTAGGRGGMGADFQEVLQNGSVDAMLEAAPKAPEFSRNFIYQRAAMKALEDGDADRARSIVNDNISEPSMRKYMTAEIERQQMMRAAAEGKMDQTRQMLARLRNNEERVMALAQLALAASIKGDKKAALALLDEARSMVSNRARNFKQLGAQLMVALAYTKLDSTRSFTILEPVVDQLNELIGAAALLGGFFTEQFVKDDEIQVGFMNSFIEMYMGQYSSELYSLARDDFDRTKALADRFQRDEIRARARLLVIQSILAPQQRSTRIVPGMGILGASPTVVIDDEP
ncbi:MAG TPA: hypothetical protein VM911_13820 [Pyrinomonadaceae bacterium]|nr:hypothetical protein [Pyrinomonadaceae bacterium]